jgi:WD40 repeat protein
VKDSRRLAFPNDVAIKAKPSKAKVTMMFVYQTMAGTSNKKKTAQVSRSSKKSTASTTSSSSYYGDAGVMETARELLKSWSADFVVTSTDSMSNITGVATNSLLMLTTSTSLKQQKQGVVAPAATAADSARLGEGGGSGNGLRRSMSDGSDDTPVTRFRKDAAGLDDDDAEQEEEYSSQVGGSGSLNNSSEEEEDDSFGFRAENDDDNDDDNVDLVSSSIDDDDEKEAPSSLKSGCETKVGDVANTGDGTSSLPETTKRKANKSCLLSRRRRPILRPAAVGRSCHDEGIEIISRKRPLVRGGGGGGGSARSSGDVVDDSNQSTVSDPVISTTSRLSEDRIQQILVAAMRYQTEHAATLPSPLPNHHHFPHHQHHQHHVPPRHARSLPTSPESAYMSRAGSNSGLVTITSPILVPQSCLSPGSPPPTLTVSTPALAVVAATPPPQASHNNRNPPPSQLLLPNLKTPPHINANAPPATSRRRQPDVNDVLHAFDDLHTNEALLMAERALRRVEEAAESRSKLSSSQEVVDHNKHHHHHLHQSTAGETSNTSRNGDGHPHPLFVDTRPWGTTEDQERGGDRRLDTIYSMGSEGDSSCPDHQQRQQQQQEQLQINRQFQQQYQQQQQQNLLKYQSQPAPLLLSQQQQHHGQESLQQQVELPELGSVEWTTPLSVDSTERLHGGQNDQEQNDAGNQLLPLPSGEDTLLTRLMSEADPVNKARRDEDKSDARHYNHYDNDNNRHNNNSNKDHVSRTVSLISTERSTMPIRRTTSRRSPPPQEESTEIVGLVRDFGNRFGMCDDEKKEANHPADVVVSNTNNECLRDKQNSRPGKEEQKTPLEVDIEELELMKSFSATESDVGSLDGLPFNLQFQLHGGDHGREDLMKRLDGVVVHTTPLSPSTAAAATPATTPVANGHGHDRSPSFFEALGLHTKPFAAPGTATTATTPVTNNAHGHDGTLQEPPDLEHRHERSPSFFESLGLSYFFGAGDNGQEENQQNDKDGNGYNMSDGADDTLALLGCAPVLCNHEERHRLPAMATSLIRVTSEPPPLSYAETIRATEVDPRLQDWLEGYYRIRGKPPSDGTYHLGKSRTVIVHEINRGNWTWCTAWSPSGDRLAVATENHHLAVIETTASTVWRVRHDRRIVGPAKNDVTHSIRSISWGQNFIAIGGTGNAVSILSPIEPYPILHVIKGTGFVGKLDWKVDSNILAIGSRLNKMMIVRVKSIDRGKKVESEILHTVKFTNWVNRVAFSPGGSCLAVGGASGKVSVYNCVDEPYEPFEISLVNTFQLEDSVLDIEWAPDGRWLYVGGEDFHITVIETNYWEVVHRIKRDRWVQCIASSNGGNFLAVGGADSEIAILDVKNGWDSVMGIGLKGLVPLWAEWHPKDQALALTGQNNSVVVVETTNARHVKGHHLHSISPILAVEFSPDGRMAVMGNEAGIVTFFSLAGSTFETAYELVVTLNDRLSISWSRNGVFVAVGTKDTILIVGSNAPLLRSRDSANRHRPPSASGFSVRKVFRDIGETNVVAIDTQSHYVAAGGDRTRIYDSTADFKLVKEWQTGVTHAIAWSPDGKLLATFGEEKNLTIHDVANKKVGRWRAIFSLNCDFTGRALAWSPINIGGLLYLAYGGRNNNVLIMEIRTLEGTWETVLRIPRDGAINDMDWSSSGLLAVGIGNGTVTIIDLAYLQSGVPVNEKDYNWQRQALTCFTEIRRNRGKNSIRTVRWIPSAPGSDSLLAMGGTDGEVEIVDLTERERCRGYVRSV